MNRCDVQGEGQVKSQDIASVKQRSWPRQKKHNINTSDISHRPYRVHLPRIPYWQSEPSGLYTTSNNASKTEVARAERDSSLNTLFSSKKVRCNSAFCFPRVSRKK